MNRRVKGKILFGTTALALVFLTACQTNNISEAQRFDTSIKKELPFRIDSLRWFDGTDMPTYKFAHHNYVTTLPDAEISMNGELSVYRTFDFQKASRQTEDKVWRNVVVSKKNQRIICVDRYLRDGHRGMSMCFKVNPRDILPWANTIGTSAIPTTSS